MLEVVGLSCAGSSQRPTPDLWENGVVSAIRSSVTQATASGQGAPAGVDAQLAKCETQLADWMACPSRKTPEGKAKIAELSDKIKTLKKRQKVADSGTSNASTPKLKSTASDSVTANQNAQGQDSRGGHEAQSGRSSGAGTLGSLVNVYA